MTARESYKSYMRGWAHGASVKAMDPRFERSSKVHVRVAYTIGYSDGYTARGTAADRASVHYKHVPSILRTQETL